MTTRCDYCLGEFEDEEPQTFCDGSKVLSMHEECAKKYYGDTVKYPKHYYVMVPSSLGVVEVECRHLIDALDLRKDFYLGAAFKYLFRCMKKGKPRQDLEKAMRCIEYALENKDDYPESEK
jgi:hypothetical protein